MQAYEEAVAKLKEQAARIQQCVQCHEDAARTSRSVTSTAARNTSTRGCRRSHSPQPEAIAPEGEGEHTHSTILQQERGQTVDMLQNRQVDPIAPDRPSPSKLRRALTACADGVRIVGKILRPVGAYPRGQDARSSSGGETVGSMHRSMGVDVPMTPGQTRVQTGTDTRHTFGRDSVHVHRGEHQRRMHTAAQTGPTRSARASCRSPPYHAYPNLGRPSVGGRTGKPVPRPRDLDHRNSLHTA